MPAPYPPRPDDQPPTGECGRCGCRYVAERPGDEDIGACPTHRWYGQGGPDDDISDLLPS